MIGLTHGSHIKTFRYCENFNDNVRRNNKFLGYLRFIEYDDNLNKICSYFKPEIKDVKTCANTYKKLRLTAQSISNEKKMLAKLKAIAQKCLDKFDTSYEEDKKRIEEDTKLTFNTRNCIVYRMGEKKVLYLIEFWIDLQTTHSNG